MIIFVLNNIDTLNDTAESHIFLLMRKYVQSKVNIIAITSSFATTAELNNVTIKKQYVRLVNNAILLLNIFFAIKYTNTTFTTSKIVKTILYARKLYSPNITYNIHINVAKRGP